MTLALARSAIIIAVGCVVGFYGGRYYMAWSHTRALIKHIKDQL